MGGTSAPSGEGGKTKWREVGKQLGWLKAMAGEELVIDCTSQYK